MRTVQHLIASFLLLGCGLALTAAENPAVTNITVADFEKLRAAKTNVVLDVRTKKEFEAGHIPGAINIDVNGPDFSKEVRALDPTKVYLVHCAAGRRGATACDKMSKLNFSKVYNLEGGMTAWERAGNKGVTGDNTKPK